MIQAEASQISRRVELPPRVAPAIGPSRYPRDPPGPISRSFGLTGQRGEPVTPDRLDRHPDTLAQPPMKTSIVLGPGQSPDRQDARPVRSG
jgi:hypothetical protein